MSATSFTGTVVEQATLAWLESVGWSVWHSAEIAPDELAEEHSAYGQAMLEQRLHDMLLQDLISGELWLSYTKRFIGRATA